MDNLFFYKNYNIHWRWEGEKEIIACFNDKYWRLNETAALIFYYCEGVDLTQLVEYFQQLKSLDKKYLFLTISKFLNVLLKEKLITSQLDLARIARDTLIFGNKAFKFSKPEIITFDIRSMDHLNFDRPETPLRVFFTINSSCNLKCKTCYNPIEKNRIFKFDLNKAKNIIDKIEKSKALEIILTGGEPFLNLYIFDIIDYILSKGIKVRINTNALLVTDERMAELKKRKDITLAIGVDGVSEKTNDFVRGKGTFKSIVEILEKLSQSGINLYINFTATHRNFYDIWKLKFFFRRFNISRIIINIFIRAGQGCKYSHLLALNKVELGVINFFNFFNRADIKPVITTITSCYAGHIETYIDYEGKIFFCDLLNHPIGDIFKRDLEEIWNSAEIFSLMDVDKFEAPCGACFFKKRCRGSCRAEVFSATGNLYSGNPYCFKGKIINRIK